MIAARQQRRRLRALTRAPLSLAILALLWVLRPGKPSLPGSLSAPLTVEAIESVILWLLWLAVGLLALALMFTARRKASRPSVANAAHLRGASSRAYKPRRHPARPVLIVSAQRASDSPTNGRAVAGEQPSVERAASGSEAVAALTRPQVSVLGPLTIAGAKRSRRGLRKAALELVAYLALYRRQVQRDELLEAFWPGQDPRRTRPRLHQAVRDARRLLGTAIASERDRYWLERTDVDVDLDKLDRFLSETRLTEDEQAQQRLLERALALFAGEPLAGSDYVWSESELRRLRATYVELLERVGRIRLESGEHRQALELAERALAVDGLNEGLWRLALEAESGLGLREAVDERYERLRTLLGERLGLEPDRKTRSLHRSLLAQG